MADGAIRQVILDEGTDREVLIYDSSHCAFEHVRCSGTPLACAVNDEHDDESED